MKCFLKYLFTASRVLWQATLIILRAKLARPTITNGDALNKYMFKKFYKMERIVNTSIKKAKTEKEKAYYHNILDIVKRGSDIYMIDIYGISFIQQV